MNDDEYWEEGGIAKTLYFTVTGEFLTNLYRDLFWQDEKPFKEVINMMQDSVKEFSEDKCIKLLEGRMKLTGDVRIGSNDSFGWEEDNEEIKPLSIKLIKAEEEVRIGKVIENIKANFKYYIDTYSCCMSTWYSTINNPDISESPIIACCHSIDALYNQLVYEKGYGDYDILKNGCSWFEDLRYTAKVVVRHSRKNSVSSAQEFAGIVYKEYEMEINEWRKQKIPFNELTDYQQSIIWRNSHYWNSQKTNKTRYIYLDQEENIRRIKFVENLEKLPKKSQKEVIFKEKPIEEIKYNYDEIDLKPIKPCKGWDGFIDPQGNFYQTKPIGIVYFKGSTDCHEYFARAYLKDKEYKGSAKDYITIKLGWCGYTHISGMEKGICISGGKRLTKKQKDTLFELFVLNKDDLSCYESLVGNS